MAPFPARHTGKNISLGLDAMVESLGLTGEQWELFCVNDNAANQKLAIKLSRHMNQYLCDNHNLELCVKDTLKNVHGMKVVLTKSRGLSTFTHKSTVATAELKRAAKKENVRFRKLANPPNTRWSGQHDLLASVLHLKKPLQHLTSSNENWTNHALSPGEWKLLEGAVTLLKPVKDTIKAFEAEKEPTMHRVIERLYTMHCIIDEFILSRENNKFGIGFARELKKQIEKRFPKKGTENRWRRIANYLAPQHKGMHLIEEDKLDDVKEDIKSEVTKIERSQDPIKNPVEHEAGVNDATPISPNTKLRMKMKAKNHRMRTLNGNENVSQLEKEIQDYERFSVANKHVNILLWWKDHEKVLPLLAKVAKKVLTIPATSSKSERVFSTGGNFVTKKRNRLAANKVEDLIVIKENKSQIEEFKARGDYQLEDIEIDAFSNISVEEVIASIVEDEEDLEDDNIFGSDTEEEEEEILFDVDEFSDDDTDSEEEAGIIDDSDSE